MHPVLFQWGSLLFPTWHALFLLAWISSFIFAYVLCNKFYPELLDKIPSAFICSYLGSLLGGRFLSVWIEEDSFDLFSLFNFSSFTFYGGFLGGVFFLTLWLQLKKLDYQIFYDLFTPPLLLGLCLGRIGCFFNGDDFGIPVNRKSFNQLPWWAVSFPNHENPIPRYPIQLVESIIALVLCGLLTLCFRFLTRYNKGSVFTAGILSYCILRFALEYYRDDFRGWMIEGSLSSSQGLSVIIAFFLICHFIFKFQRSPH